MFLKTLRAASAAADAHSFSWLASPPNGKLSSLCTRPPKPTLLNSRNSRSLLQMFRKISSAAADAHSFSSLAAPPNGKLSSLFTRPPKPTPLSSRNSRSLFTYAENSRDEPKFWVSALRLKKFLQTNCKSGDVSADEAFRFFHRMVQMEPRFPLYSFNLLLRGLAENERYYDALSLYGKMNSAGLILNFVTLNILIDCSCKANRVSDGFLVMGRIMRMGYRPNIETFNSLIEGLCIGNRVADAVQLVLRMEKYGCCSDAITCATLISWQCRTGYVINRETLEEMSRDNVQYGGRCKPKVVSNSSIIDKLCKEGKEDKIMELFSDIDAPRGAVNHSRPSPQSLFCNSLAHCAGNDVKGQEELKPNIHSKEKAPTCLPRETPHDQLNLKGN